MSIARPGLRCGVCAIVMGWALLVLGVSGADAAVGFRQATAASGSTPGAATNALALTVARPSGLAVDDVMVASVQWVLRTANGSKVAGAAPAGWTELDNNNQTGFAVALWWKRATAADVAASGFTFTGSWTNRQAIAAGVISTFSGVTRNGSPFAWGPVRRTGFGGYPNYAGATIGNEGYGFARPGDTTYSAPAHTPVPGSLGVVAAMVTGTGSTGQLDLGAVANGTVAAAQPATGGGGVDGINTAMAYATPDASGTHADPYVQMTFSRAVDRTAYSLVLQPTPCGAGGLGLSPPGSVSFPTTALTGSDLTLTTRASLVVDDQSEDGATSSGWKLTLSPTTFASGSGSLPASALSIVAATPSDGGGRCAAPTNGVTYPLTVPSGTATKIFSSAANTGRGASALALDFALAVPASARLGTYASTWTYSLSFGP